MKRAGCSSVLTPARAPLRCRPFTARPLRLAVRTSPSHGENTSSILVGVTSDFNGLSVGVEMHSLFAGISLPIQTGAVGRALRPVDSMAPQDMLSELRAENLHLVESFTAPRTSRTRRGIMRRSA